MSSCLLFHGPGSRQTAVDRAYEIGRLMAPPFGDEGLKVEDARQVVELLLSTPIGTEVGVVVVGPMDQANYKASDVLLKCIEESPNRFVRPILWAYDLGDVSATIRSRCLDQWCPSTGEDMENDEILPVAWKLISAVLDGEWENLLSVHRAKTDEIALLQALSGVLVTDLGDQQKQALWGRLREVSRWRNPQVIEIISALVED